MNRSTAAVMLVSGWIAGCGTTPEEYRKMPTPLLCKEAITTPSQYIFYDELLEELNSRDEDCEEYVKAQMRGTSEGTIIIDTKQ